MYSMLPCLYQVVVHCNQLRRWHAIGRQNTQRHSEKLYLRWVEHTAKPAESADSAGFLFAGLVGAPRLARQFSGLGAFESLAAERLG